MFPLVCSLPATAAAPDQLARPGPLRGSRRRRHGNSSGHGDRTHAAFVAGLSPVAMVIIPVATAPIVSPIIPTIILPVVARVIPPVAAALVSGLFRVVIPGEVGPGAGS